MWTRRPGLGDTERGVGLVSTGKSNHMEIKGTLFRHWGNSEVAWASDGLEAGTLAMSGVAG